MSWQLYSTLLYCWSAWVLYTKTNWKSIRGHNFPKDSIGMGFLASSYGICFLDTKCTALIVTNHSAMWMQRNAPIKNNAECSKHSPLAHRLIYMPTCFSHRLFPMPPLSYAPFLMIPSHRLLPMLPFRSHRLLSMHPSLKLGSPWPPSYSLLPMLSSFSHRFLPMPHLFHRLLPCTQTAPYVLSLSYRLVFISPYLSQTCVHAIPSHTDWFLFPAILTYCYSWFPLSHRFPMLSFITLNHSSTLPLLWCSAGPLPLQKHCSFADIK